MMKLNTCNSCGSKINEEELKNIFKFWTGTLVNGKFLQEGPVFYYHIECLKYGNILNENSNKLLKQGSIA